MADQLSTDPVVVAQIRNELNDVARLLRAGEHLSVDAQHVLPTLLEEFGAQLDASAMPSEQTIHLAGLVSQLARSIHEQHHADLLTSARKRLTEAAGWSDSLTPAATDLINRLIDVVASIGI